MHAVVDGILTNYQTVGQKNKPVLLILHGWKRSLPEWIPIATQLSENYYVVLLDLPGFGQTSLPTTIYTIYDCADFVEHFLRKLDIKKMTLLGHSFGGRIGIILGAKTKLLEKLILVDAAGVEKRSTLAKVKIILFKVLKPCFPERWVEKLRQMLGSPDYKTSGELRKIFVRVINEDLTYLLPKVSVSTLLIWGSTDAEVPLWKTKLMKKMLPNAKLRVVWGAGHSPYLEKPREFMEIVKEEL